MVEFHVMYVQGMFLDHGPRGEFLLFRSSYYIRWHFALHLKPLSGNCKLLPLYARCVSFQQIKFPVCYIQPLALHSI